MHLPSQNILVTILKSACINTVVSISQAWMKADILLPAHIHLVCHWISNKLSIENCKNKKEYNSYNYIGCSCIWRAVMKKRLFKPPAVGRANSRYILSN